MIVGILLFQAVAFAVLSGIVASKKNRDPAGWGILGFLFGLFAFIAALVVEKVEPEEKQPTSKKKRTSSSQEFNPDEHEKKCPMCAEYIKLEARRCKHCGHEMSEEEVEKQIEERKQEVEKRREERSEEREVRDPDDLEAPPIDEVATRCGECHYPLRGDEKKCPKCQRELVWS